MGIEKVLIVDWDVHHGNGTQRVFEEDPSVLYFSVHRHDNGRFYPATDYGFYESAGTGEGEGYSINLPWPRGGAGDPENILAWRRLLMPIARDFDPGLVIISAGFDAAKGDPLGGCLISPPAYNHLTSELQSLAGGKVVVALEGGYNLDSISKSMAACGKALLKEEAMYPQESLDHIEDEIDVELEDTIEETREYLSQYWSCLKEVDEAYDTRRSLRLVRAAEEAGAKLCILPGTAVYGFPAGRGRMDLLEVGFNGLISSAGEEGGELQKLRPLLLCTARENEIHVVARTPEDPDDPSKNAQAWLTLVLGALELEHEGLLEGVVVLPDGNPLCAKVSITAREHVRPYHASPEDMRQQALQAATEAMIQLGFTIPIQAENVTETKVDALAELMAGVQV